MHNQEIKYRCGHIFSRESLLPNKLSIINPICKTCGIGKLEGYVDEKSPPKIRLSEKPEIDWFVPKKIHPTDSDYWIGTPIVKYIEYGTVVHKYNEDNGYYEDEYKEEYKDEYEDEEDEVRRENIFSCHISLWGLSLLGLFIGLIREMRLFRGDR